MPVLAGCVLAHHYHSLYIGLLHIQLYNMIHRLMQLYIATKATLLFHTEQFGPVLILHRGNFCNDATGTLCLSAGRDFQNWPYQDNKHILYPLTGTP